MVAIHGGERSIALDITDRVLGEDERGLLGLVLHPDWPEDGRAFVHYSDRGSDGDTVLSEFTGTQDGDAAPVLDPASERVLLTVDQPYANHNGGYLAFGPDGFLYVGLGDGGSFKATRTAMGKTRTRCWASCCGWMFPSGGESYSTAALQSVCGPGWMPAAGGSLGSRVPQPMALHL